MNVRTRRELERLMHFNEMATAWLFVASGASLIASKRHGNLSEVYDWSRSAFIAIVRAMLAACIAHTILRVQRRQAVLAHARPDRCDE
jgi:hypothetical protein